MPTIPGYSKVLLPSPGEVAGWGEGSRSQLARLSRVDLSGPHSTGAREALTAAADKHSMIGKQLALVEMLMALGTAREPGSLEEALHQLGAMEDDFANSLSDLLETCGLAPSPI